RILYSDVHLFPFFFSSRRRHTRSTRDWSSDVCSSDLARPTSFAMSYTHAIRLQPALTIEKEVGLAGLALLREAIAIVAARHGARSEERRVGKEWRGGGAGEG